MFMVLLLGESVPSDSRTEGPKKHVHEVELQAPFSDSSHDSDSDAPVSTFAEPLVGDFDVLGGDESDGTSSF